MYDDAVEVVGHERAARAALLPSRAEHEVINDQLAASCEEVGERCLALGAVENVVLFDLDPGQLAPLPAEFIPLPGKLLLFAEQLFSCCNPLFLGNNFVVLDCAAGDECCSCHVNSPVCVVLIVPVLVALKVLNLCATLSGRCLRPDLISACWPPASLLSPRPFL